MINGWTDRQMLVLELEWGVSWLDKKLIGWLHKKGW